MKNYLHLLREVLEHGQQKPDRTGTGTRSLFGRQLRFDLREGFPAVTTKKLFFKGVVVELLWMLRGDTNIKWLNENGCTIWDEWADEEGELGPVYGGQWRSWTAYCAGEKHLWREFDQIEAVLKGLKEDPHGRRHIVNAWNVGQLHQMKLPPCHMMFQFYVGGPASDELSCHMYQRSADILLGVPFNIASYALLTHIVAAHLGMKVAELIISFGDVHLYSNHEEQARQQLLRSPKKLPTLSVSDLNEGQSIFHLAPSQFALHNYDSWPAIKADVAV